MRWPSRWLLGPLVFQVSKHSVLSSCYRPPPFMDDNPLWTCKIDEVGCKEILRRQMQCLIHDQVELPVQFQEWLDAWIESKRTMDPDEVLSKVPKVLRPRSPDHYWCVPANKVSIAWVTDQDDLLDELIRQLSWFDRVHSLEWYRYGLNGPLLSNEGWWSLVLRRIALEVLEARLDSDPVFYYRYFGPFVPLPGLSDCLFLYRRRRNWINPFYIYFYGVNMLRTWRGHRTYCEDLFHGQMELLRTDVMYASVQEVSHPTRDNVLVFHNSGDDFGNIPLPKILNNYRWQPSPNRTFGRKSRLLTFMGTWDDGGLRKVRHVLIPILRDALKKYMHVGKASGERFLEEWSKSDFCLIPRGFRRRAFMESECLALADCVCVYIWDDFERLPYRDSAAHWSKLGMSLQMTPDLPNTLLDSLQSVTQADFENYRRNMRIYSESHYTFEGLLEQLFGFLTGGSSDLVCDQYLDPDEITTMQDKATDLVRLWEDILNVR
ncbi:MAG: hypothetical protein KVP17_003799 [Porospora cf. gigantea B]|uniref:uncharacterized protein n=1 Tax=Porospora cf. gigantea B TaxID=2853592 RepID=UPI003571C781|nr:MAG: hypothetical protein KVP17_003799 [Porospora cf. gigantea B]